MLGRLRTPRLPGVTEPRSIPRSSLRRRVRSWTRRPRPSPPTRSPGWRRASIAAWHVGTDRLTREFRFGTFNAAFGLATRIALVAEQQGHHPTLEIAWGRLVVTWQTDAIGAITANDLIMAARVDRIVARGLGLKDG